jgi:ACS family tartrate transporter-like MFS transporter
MVARSNDTSIPITPESRAVDEAVRSAAWRVIPLLAVGYIVSYIDRANISFAALTMNKDLGLTATQFGFIAGTFYVGYCLFEIPSNVALQRFGARRWLSRIMVSWGLAAAGTCLAQGPTSLAVFRFLTGACEAGFYPGVMFYLSVWFPVEVRARAFAWFNIANPMSSVISGPLSISLLGLDGHLGLAGWRWLLLCEGLPACLLGIYILYSLSDGPRDARWLSDDQKSALERRLAAEQHPGKEQDLWKALRDPQILILSCSFFCVVVGIQGITLWLPQVLRHHGLSMTTTGLIATVPFLLACIGIIMWSYRMDRTRAFLANHIGCCALAAFGFAVAGAVDSVPGLIVGASMALIGMNASRPALFSLVPVYLQGPAAAAGMAVVTSIGNLGGFFGPLMMGRLKDSTGSFATGLLGLAGVLALAALVALLVKAVARPAVRTH